jgi:predicted alpha-1,2-mannosidase
LGRTELAYLFHNRSKNYKNVWSEVEFFCPKTYNKTSKQFTWHCPEWWQYIDVFDDRYVEGDAWHWRWFVPHDPAGLIQLFGTPNNFINQLTEFFDLSTYDPFNFAPNPYYWAGNEPDIFSGWLFAFAGRPDLTQKYIRMIMKTRYSVAPDGLPGNDDYGTMSAWYLLSALGFYPQSGGTKYILGSPVFPQVSLYLEDNQKIVIVAHNASETNLYVQKMAINGQPWTTPFIDHFQLVNNETRISRSSSSSDSKTGTTTTTLEFWMGNSPSSWGSSFPQLDLI